MQGENRGSLHHPGQRWRQGRLLAGQRGWPGAVTQPGTFPERPGLLRASPGIKGRPWRGGTVNQGRFGLSAQQMGR